MHEFRVRPPAPFSFERTAAFLSPGADDLVDVFDGKRYTRLLDLNGRMRLALVSTLGAEQRPELIVTLMNGTERDEPLVGSMLSHLLAFDYDLDSFYETCRQDQLLYGLSRDHYGLKPVRRPHPFETLVLAIASRRPGSHFFRASVSELAVRYSYKVAYAGDTFYAFPSPKVLAKQGADELVCESLDSRQARQLYTLCAAAADGDFDMESLSRLPLPDLLSALLEVPGVDSLGAQLTALIGYGRLRCFPLADPLVRSWIARNYHDTDTVDEDTAAEWADQWGSVRGLVGLHIYADLREQGTI